MENPTTPQSRPWDVVNPMMNPTVIVEVRGTKLETIRWTDKQTRQQQEMLKYAVSCEFVDGTQVRLAQMGREFTFPYDFQRGKMYIFAIRGYEIDRDSITGDFVGVAPYEAKSEAKVGSPAPASK